MGIIVFACKELGSLDPSKDLKLKITYKAADSFIEAQIKNAVSGNLITSDVTIEILGAQAANVINFEGEAKSKYTKKGPSFYIGFRNVIPSQTSPVKFKVLISADGYLSNSRDIVLTNAQNSPIEISLVKIDTPPVGSAIKQGNVSVTASGASQSTTLEVVNNQQATTVAVNQGTIMNDSKGNAVTGNLTTTVAIFSGTSTEALKSLPGGSAIVLAKDKDGKSNVSAALVPLAFAEITIKSSSGAVVTNFTKPISISFGIDPSTINPTTKEKVEVGDSFSVYTYSNANGAWTYEKEGKVISKNDKLFVSFETDHLSGFLIGEAKTTLKTIQVNLTVEGTTSTSIANGSGFDYDIYYKSSGSTTETLYSGRFSSPNGTPVKLTSSIQLPDGIESMRVVFNHPISGKKTDLTVPNPNSNQIDLSVPLGVASLPKLKTISITVSCPNGRLDIQPNGVGIEYNYNTTPGNSEKWIYAGNVNTDPADGKIKLITNLPDNTNLLFRAIAYPDYTQVVNTGASTSFAAEIKLPKTNKLCQ